MYDYNGVVDAFEQCDNGADNTCCNKGRFTRDGANCATGDSQVCFICPFDVNPIDQFFTIRL